MGAMFRSADHIRDIALDIYPHMYMHVIHMSRKWCTYTAWTRYSSTFHLLSHIPGFRFLTEKRKTEKRHSRSEIRDDNGVSTHRSPCLNRTWVILYHDHQATCPANKSSRPFIPNMKPNVHTTCKKFHVVHFMDRRRQWTDRSFPFTANTQPRPKWTFCVFSWSSFYQEWCIFQLKTITVEQA